MSALTAGLSARAELATVTAQRDDELGAAVAALFEADDARAACTDLADSLDGMQEVRYLALRERNEALTAGNALRDRLAEAEEEIRRLADQRDTAERLLAEAPKPRTDRGRIMVNIVPAPPLPQLIPVRVPCRRCGG